jgi:hypothetical protein
MASLKPTGSDLDGRLTQIERTINKYDWNGQTLAYSIIHDVTDRKKLEEELRKATTELARSNENCSNSPISHRMIFRNPYGWSSTSSPCWIRTTEMSWTPTPMSHPLRR